MPLPAKANEKQYTPPPMGLHLAICIGVYDLGTQHSELYGDTRKVYIAWELPEEKMEDDRPYTITRIFTLSLHKKSSLRPILESWRGKAFTQDELNGFDLFNILGHACQVQVNHDTKDDGSTRGSVVSVVPKPKAYRPMKPANQLRKFSFWDTDPIPEGTPDWIKEMIQKSKEWRSRNASSNPDSEPANASDGNDDGSDIPF